MISTDTIYGKAKLKAASKIENSTKSAGNRYVANVLPFLPLHYTIAGWSFQFFFEEKKLDYYCLKTSFKFKCVLN
jgi:hypothetical protein